MTPDGRFDVAYDILVEEGVDAIILNQYTAGGVLTTSQTLYASSVADEAFPSVSMDNFADAVVAWRQDLNSNLNVLARRVAPSGPAGPVISIPATDSYEMAPIVALAPDGTGDFVVAYSSQTSPTNEQLNVAEVTLPQSLRIGLPPSSTITYYQPGPGLYSPALSINNADQYLLTYTSTSTSNSFTNIAGNLGQLPPSTTVQPGPRL
jgi:hypothetical protein